MSQTLVLIITLLAMAAPGFGYGLGWCLDPKRAFWRVIRALGEVHMGVVCLTAAAMELIAEHERLMAAYKFEPGKAN
jgi:hypothetical protein